MKDLHRNGKIIAIEAREPDFVRVCVADFGVPQNYYIEKKDEGSKRGNIYKGIIDRFEPSLQAAFVKYGSLKNGFLPLAEFPSEYRKGKRAPEVGAEVLVQIAREETEEKGAYLTTYLSLAGRYLVLMPTSKHVGISRKIESDQERERLRVIAQELYESHHLGLIVRTAGYGVSKREIVKDFRYLLRVWKAIYMKAKVEKAPCLLYQEPSLALRTIRDCFTADVSEIIVDDEVLFHEIKEFMKSAMPRYQKVVRLYTDRVPLFIKLGLEDKLSVIFERRVDLPSGGYIVIEPTDAFISIDVNSGKATAEANFEETAYKTNIEACREIARQIRLRGFGGLIVVDFLNMRERRHIDGIEKELKSLFKGDRAKTDVLKMSKFGLVEISRQRMGSSAMEFEFDKCPLCEGSGVVRSVESKAVALVRELKSIFIEKGIKKVEIEADEDLFEYLLNEKKVVLTELEKEFGARIYVFSKEHLKSPCIKFLV